MIGVFDSGVRGLTVLRALRARTPHGFVYVVSGVDFIVPLEKVFL